MKLRRTRLAVIQNCQLGYSIFPSYPIYRVFIGLNNNHIKAKVAKKPVEKLQKSIFHIFSILTDCGEDIR